MQAFYVVFDAMFSLFPPPLSFSHTPFLFFFAPALIPSAITAFRVIYISLVGPTAEVSYLAGVLASPLESGADHGVGDVVLAVGVPAVIVRHNGHFDLQHTVLLLM